MVCWHKCQPFVHEQMQVYGYSLRRRFAETKDQLHERCNHGSQNVTETGWETMVAHFPLEVGGASRWRLDLCGGVWVCVDLERRHLQHENSRHDSPRRTAGVVIGGCKRRWRALERGAPWACSVKAPSRFPCIFRALAKCCPTPDSSNKQHTPDGQWRSPTSIQRSTLYGTGP